jgi:ferritin-like protein
VSESNLHEDKTDLSTETIDEHRAYRSLMEELEAIDWYAQRVNATDDETLQAVLAHNRDEEKEHAAMVLEWLRRRDPVLDKHLRAYLFTEGSITDIEEDVEASDGGRADLGIGSLRENTNARQR